MLRALWPDGMPESTWWRSALGLAVAACIANSDLEVVGRAEASRILGKSISVANPLIADGKLRRGPDGHAVMRGDVLARLVRLSAAAERGGRSTTRAKR